MFIWVCVSVSACCSLLGNALSDVNAGGTFSSGKNQKTSRWWEIRWGSERKLEACEEALTQSWMHPQVCLTVSACPLCLYLATHFSNFFLVLFLDVPDRMMPALVAIWWTLIYLYITVCKHARTHLRVFWHQTINIGLCAQVHTPDNYLCPHRIHFLPVGVCNGL